MPRRRWLQFSLRTAFVGLTVFAVWLGVIVNRAREQREAVKAIEALGGWVTYDSLQASDSLLRRWLPQDYIDGVEEVSLRSTRATDDVVAHLKALKELERLQLDSCYVTDAGLAHLQGLTNLRVLTLDYTRITDTGLVHLVRLTKLRWLFLQETGVTGEGIARLKKALPNCEIHGP
jgi:hypothetical protein